MKARLRFIFALRVLPRKVATFYRRATKVARRSEDRFSLDSAARPRELAELLDLADGRKRIAELGTGTAWTTIAFVLANEEAKIVSFDPIVRSERERYLDLVGAGVRDRIELIEATGEQGAASSEPVDMLFVDSSHAYDETIAEFRVWSERLNPQAVVAFHDYNHPDYPGVARAIADLGLEGEVVGGMFVWRAP